MSIYVGIDLGTTFSAIAFIDELGRPQIIRSKQGENIIPSCITEKEGNIEVGEHARRIWNVAPERAAAFFKREMGTSKVFKVNDKSFSPTDLSAFILRKLKQVAEKEKGDIFEAVITVPANFGNKSREATMSSAEKAGLKVKFIINEPTAAALYYAFIRGEELSGVYAVYDLGGGTFDVSIIRVDGQDIEVISSNGVHKLGGYDFDKAFFNIVSKKYKEETGEEHDSAYYGMVNAEQDKKTLSDRKEVEPTVGKKFIKVSRKEFEDEISPLIAQAEMLCESILDEVGIEPSGLKAVFLAGGSTRIPAVRESVQRVFQQEPIASVNVDEVVALGAALYAAFKSDKSKLSGAQKEALKKIKVTESTGKCYGTIARFYNEEREKYELENTVLIKKGDKIPCSMTKQFFTVEEDQRIVRCMVTESSSPESDPKFVEIIWEGNLEVPPGRPQGQKVEVTFSYDDNQIMHCKFLDVESGKDMGVSLSMTSSDGKNKEDIDKFAVE